MLLIGAAEMMKGALLTLLVIACLLLWSMIIVPMIAKCFRVPYALGTLPFHRRNHALTNWQSFWFAGVLGWGGTVFLATALIHYFNDSKLTIPQLLLTAVSYLIVGGLLGWSIRSGRRQTS